MLIQGKGSKTFRVPPGFLEANVPVPALWDHHLEHCPEHPIFVYENGPNDIRTLYWSQAARAIHRAARFIQTKLAEHNISNSDPSTPVVIAILASKDTLSYWTLLTGIMRAGYHAFVISTRNSSAAVTHLLKAMKCKMLFVSQDQSMRDLSQEALKGLDYEIVTVDTPFYDEFFLAEDAPFEALPPFQLASMDSPVLTIHSSGSTNFPKPIPVTHRVLATWSLNLYYGTVDMCGKIMSSHAMPMFHAMGVIFAINFTAGAGLVCGIFRPQQPPVPPLPEKILAGALAVKANWIVVVPSLLEDWSHAPDALASLKTFEAVIYGGGPIAMVTGNFLVEQGVNLRIGYGTTEVGAPGEFSINKSGKDWPYFKETTQMNIYWKPHEDGLFEPIVLTTPTYAPCVCNTVIDGVPAYATNDLCVPHPTKKGYWMIHGRADDQIMHSTGEKTNPGPLETIISNHPAIRACVMFGRARFQTGILIEPVPDKKFDPTDTEKLAAYRNEIWPQIEKANDFGPKHSRLFKEMLIVTSPAKPFSYTAKGTVRRPAMIQLYEEEIQAAYVTVEDSSRHDVPLPDSWDVENATAFVRALVGKLIPKSVEDDADLFQVGADSLQATYLRLSIIQAFRDTNQSTSDLAQNLVYAHPTITSLGLFISNLATGKSNGNVVSPSSSVDEMKKMVEEFTSGFPKHTPSKPPSAEEAILVTGTTGSLGTYILDKLVSMPSIRRVYALNRPSKDNKTTLRERQIQAFTTHGVDASLIDSSKLVLLEGDSSLPDLGLPKEQIDEIVGSVTSIIHNAWRVDFNVPLSSFKPLIVGVRNLINLALSSPFSNPPSIVFTSSVGVVSGWTEQKPVPEVALENPETALANGYSQSKWVAERILDAANKNASMHNVVVRVGQLCGSTVKGSWNQWEWFPSIVQSSKLVHCLPDATGLITWIPVDIAAAAAVEMRTSPAPYLHLVHPKPVTWTSIITPIAKALDVPVVPYEAWLGKLNNVLERAQSSSTADQVEAARENPALRLIDFYRNASIPGNVDDNSEAFVKIRLNMDVTKKLVETLGDPDLPTLGSDDAKHWLAYWDQIGVLESRSI